MSDKFRTWLSKELETRHWSQRELARQSGISQAQVSQTLSGDLNPSADFCIKIAQALGETPEKVLRLAEILPQLSASEDDPILKEINDAVRNMTSKQRKEVLRYIRYLYQSGQEDD